MSGNRKKTMNRKEFVTVSASGLVGIGLGGCTPGGVRRKKTGAVDVQYRALGKTGLKLSTVGFGASRTEDPSVIRRITGLGVNIIDTGRMYSEGRNEELIGKVIRDIRKDIIIQSKFFRKYLTDTDQILKSIDESLAALGTDYIDIMLKQSAITTDELLAPPVLEAITRAKEAGKIRFSGFSTHDNQAMMIREAVKSGFYDIVLVAYNHAGNYTHSVSKDYHEWDQAELEREIANAARAGMGVIAMKTCSGGPYKYPGEEKATYASGLRKILENKNITSVIPAMASFAHVDENVRAMG